MNKIGWCDKTINAIVGCNIRCGSWCYARKQAKRQKHNCLKCYRFEPHAHLDRLEQLTPNQKPMKIFMDSMSDWCSPGVDPDWIWTIINKMKQCSQHIFLVLSKNPKGFEQYKFPQNVWLGTSITTTNEIYRVHELMDKLNYHPLWGGNYTFLSVEPMLGIIPGTVIHGVDWVIIGALSRTGKPPLQPKKKWVECIITSADDFGIPVYTKDNLTVVEPRKEFPKAMEHTFRKVE